MRPQSRRSTKRGVFPFCAFLCAVLYAVAVQATCGCFSCLSGASCALWTSVDGDGFSPVTENLDADEAVPYAEFQIGNRWTTTATNGTSSRSQGQPVDLTWGLLSDGTSISGSEGRSPSDLIAMLNTEIGASTGGIQDAPWFRLFEESFGRWSELSGVTYSYEPIDLGAELNNTTTPSGSLGRYADTRIGGHSIDGTESPNTLAYNYFPNHADMVLDTDNSAFYGSSFSDYRRLRNVLMHEAGHGLGLDHLESSDSSQLMEPFISTAFDGPQIDDILAIQRNYGDVYEKNGGNDNFLLSDDAGIFGDGDAWSIGTDGDSRVVSSTQTDFISIDDDSDVDYFKFSVTEAGIIDIDLTQVGITYQEGSQGGTQTALNASTLNQLELELERLDGSGTITEAQGERVASLNRESIESFTVSPGEEYFVRVSGTENNVQLYQLDLAFTAIPEPAAVVLALLAAPVLGRSRRAA